MSEKDFRGFTGGLNPVAARKGFLNDQWAIPLIHQTMDAAQREQRSELKFNRAGSIPAQQRVADDHGVLSADHLHAFFDRPAMSLEGPAREWIVAESAQRLIAAGIDRVGIFVARQR